MNFNAKKSCSVVLKKYNAGERFKLKITGKPILTVEIKPIECIGKFFNKRLKDTTNVNNIGEQL